MIAGTDTRLESSAPGALAAGGGGAKAGAAGAKAGEPLKAKRQGAWLAGDGAP